MSGRVLSVSRSPEHTFAKSTCDRIRLLEGLGVEGDAHAGVTVKHRSRVAKDPTQPNLRQVHLFPAELLETLREEGFALGPGRLGENVLTEGIDLHGLSRGTRLVFGDHAVIEVTGLRNPCRQLEDVGEGLMRRLTPRGADGSLVRIGGIMAIVLRSGDVEPGMAIRADAPSGPRVPLDRV